MALPSFVNFRSLFTSFFGISCHNRTGHKSRIMSRNTNITSIAILKLIITTFLTLIHHAQAKHGKNIRLKKSKVIINKVNKTNVREKSGLIESTTNTMANRRRNLIAYMSDYPTCGSCDTGGNFEEPTFTEFPRGRVIIEQGDGDDVFDMKIYMDMRGIPPNCRNEKNDYVKNGCGIHIHEGMTCSDQRFVKGHYWNKESLGEGDANDPWIKYKGSGQLANNGPAIQFDSNSEGEALDQWIFFEGGNGFKVEENVYHAVVIHDENGVRKSCGVLNWDK